MTDLLSLSEPELKQLMTDLSEPGFRAGQLLQWLHQKGAREFGEMTNLSKPLRAKLAEHTAINVPMIAQASVSRDGTAKFLLRLADGETIETVLIPAEDHLTQCLSSQVGCAMGCAFCATGQMGFTRNLTTGEIVGQVLAARHWLATSADAAHLAPLALRNLVLMGMGEPFLNTANVLKALELFRHPMGYEFSRRRITVSTVGIVKGIQEFGAADTGSLAVSLHAPTQELRAKLLTQAAKTQLDELMAALDAYPLRQRERITYEYVLLHGVNDSLTEAKQLHGLLSPRKAKVNLIAFNPPPEDTSCSFRAPDPATVDAFQRYLWDRGTPVTLRKSMGQDIAAACGQLKTLHGA